MEESPLGLDLAQSRGLAGASEQQAALPTLSQLSILPCVSKGSHGVAQGPLWSLQWWWAVEKTQFWNWAWTRVSGLRPWSRSQIDSSLNLYFLF